MGLGGGSAGVGVGHVGVQERVCAVFGSRSDACRALKVLSACAGQGHKVGWHWKVCAPLHCVAVPYDIVPWDCCHADVKLGVFGWCVCPAADAQEPL